MKLVQAWLSAGNVWQSRFNGRGGAVKHVEAYLSAKKIDKAVVTPVEVLWSSCKPVYVRKRPDKAVLNAEEEARASLFKSK